MADFGLTQFHSTAKRARFFAGTPKYLGEAVNDRRENLTYSDKDDLFALGVMFLETLTNNDLSKFYKASDVYTYARSYPLVKNLSGMLRNMLNKGRKINAVKKASNRYNYGGYRQVGNYGGYG